MRASLFACAVVAGFLAATPALGRCVSEAEIEAAIGDQIRSGAPTIDTGQFADVPLCSGLTLAQQIQRMREAGDPQLQAARAQAEAARAGRAASDAAARSAAVAAPVAGPVYGAEPVRTASRGPLVLTTAALGITLAEMLDRIVLADSRSWMVNRYIRGSIRNARYLTTNKRRDTYTAMGLYSFRGFGSGEGWVKVRVRAGTLDCLEFWDQPGTCRPFGASLSQQALVAGMIGLMTSGGGSSGSNSNSIADAEEANRRRSGTPAPTPAPPPVTPIGGANGLYGCSSPPCM